MTKNVITWEEAREELCGGSVPPAHFLDEHIQAHAIIDTLLDKSGFDDWWDEGLSDADQNEIFQEFVEILQGKKK